MRSDRAAGGPACAILTGAAASYMALYLYAALTRGDAHPFGDFFALWSYARIALDHPATALYDPDALHAAQVSLGMPAAESNPFPYPPSFLLMLAPLGAVPWQAACPVWIGGTFALYAWSVCAGDRGDTAGWLAVAFAPTTTINLVAGQSGFLLAALLIGGVRLSDRRPILAGALFGLLTFKPQFGLLVPVALAAARRWRCIAAACATAAGLFVATSAVFGAGAWLAWLQATPAYASRFDQLPDLKHMPTVLANLEMLGASRPCARLAQAAATLAAAVVAWVGFRRPGALAAPILLAAAALATPHAWVYDLPVLGGAVALFLGAHSRSGRTLTAPVVAALLLVSAFPAVMAWGELQAPVSGLAIASFLAVLMRLDEPLTLRPDGAGARSSGQKSVQRPFTSQSP